jgi:hypothetical protein
MVEVLEQKGIQVLLVVLVILLPFLANFFQEVWGVQQELLIPEVMEILDVLVDLELQEIQELLDLVEQQVILVGKELQDLEIQEQEEILPIG